MEIIIPLSIPPEDDVLKAWKDWDKVRSIFRYKTEDDFGSGVASKFEIDDEDASGIEAYARKLEEDFNKFYSGFKFGMMQKS